MEERGEDEMSRRRRRGKRRGEEGRREGKEKNKSKRRRKRERALIPLSGSRASELCLLRQLPSCL